MRKPERTRALTREAGRLQVWADMEAQGLTLDTQPHTVRVPRSQRSGEIIEPRISTQWFLRMQEMADVGHPGGTGRPDRDRAPPV